MDGGGSVPKALSAAVATADSCFRDWLSKIDYIFENQVVYIGKVKKNVGDSRIFIAFRSKVFF